MRIKFYIQSLIRIIFIIFFVLGIIYFFMIVVPDKCIPHDDSIKEGIKNGLWWGRNPESKSYKRIRNKFNKRYAEYDELWERYSKGKLKKHMALISVTEAPEGPSQCSSDKLLKECGIMGLKWKDAEKCDIDVCNPGASIWCAGYLANSKQLKFLEIYPQAKQLPLWEIYMLSGMSGGIGPSAYKLIKYSNALKTKPNGELIHKSPYHKILNFARGLDKESNEDKLFIILKNRRFGKYTLGFRIARIYATLILMTEFYGVESIEDLPFQKPELVDRPDYFPKYPGIKLHGKCNLNHS